MRTERRTRRNLRLYFDFADWWVGYYRGDTHHYVIVIPTLVLRWDRRTTRERS